MKNRITENEKRLDKISKVVNELEKSLDAFEEIKDDLEELNKYYGSKEWLKDKDDFEKGKIKRVKAGVLSEDAVWDLDEQIAELKKKFKEIAN